jgi:hypothetical protein
MADFVTLTCPSCGGKLQITTDIEHFACAHCGNEHVVNRAGGVVSLAPVSQELKDVKKGVDRTASELTIKRLTKEIDDLEKQYVILYDRKSEIQKGFFGLIGFRDNELKNVDTKMKEIMRIARKKNSELMQHQKAVEL